MENISDALKIAFATIVFMIGISILFSLVASIKQTADEALLYSDKTNFYIWESGTGKSGKIVQEKEVIASLYEKNESVEEIHIFKDNKEIYPDDSIYSIAEFINRELCEGNTYMEQIVEINPGQFIYASDGTRIRVTGGATKLQKIYIKQ